VRDVNLFGLAPFLYLFMLSARENSNTLLAALTFVSYPEPSIHGESERFLAFLFSRRVRGVSRVL
jgi:hypothetical protein